MRRVGVSVPLTEGVLRACALFGLEPRYQKTRARTDGCAHALASARTVARALGVVGGRSARSGGARGGGRGSGRRAGVVALLVGASGAGKSSVLRELEGIARARWDGRVARVTGRAAARPLADLGGRAPLSWLRTLARAGLAEAMVFVRLPPELSTGQRARLSLALAMRRAELLARRGPTLVVADEFCSALDRETAASVARSVGRWARETERVTLVCATAHSDMAGMLGADLVWEVVEFGGLAEVG